jgi:hypothetical protein
MMAEMMDLTDCSSVDQLAVEMVDWMVVDLAF